MHALDINITSKCNYKCEYCFAKSEIEGEMSEDIFKKVLKIAKVLNVKYLSFCGGEPLLHKKFATYVELARKSDFKLILRTNGIFINKYIDVISKNFEWVAISLDGTKELNSKMRIAKNNISASMKFQIPILNLLKIKKSNKKIKIIIASVASKINYDGIFLLQSYILKNKLPVDLWKIYLFKPSEGRSLKYEYKYNLGEDKFRCLYDNLNIEKLQKSKVRVLLNDSSIKQPNCIIVSPSGDITLGQNKLFDIKKTSLLKIKKYFEKAKFVKRVENNKVNTYQ